MAPTTPARSKKRTRQDLVAEENGSDDQHPTTSRNDEEFKSPQAKKRNTAKTPSREADTPSKDTRTSRRSRQASQPLPPQSQSPPVEEAKQDEEVVDVNHNHSILGNGGGLLSMLKKSMTVNKATTESVTVPQPPPEKERTETITAAPSGDTATDVDPDRDTSSSRPSFTVHRQSDDSLYRGRRVGWSCLLLGTWLAVVLGVVLWTSVVVHDATERDMEIHRCRRSLAAAADRKSSLSTNNNSKDKFYLQDLEKQVRYWKKQAKQNEAFAKGYKDEYQAILKQLLEGESVSNAHDV